MPDQRREAIRDLSRVRQAVKERPPGQAPADLVIDAAAGTHLSGQGDLGTSTYEVADGAEARASRAAHRIRRAN